MQGDLKGYPPKVQQDSEALSLQQALGILRRRMLIILLCAVVVAGAAYGFSSQQTKKYVASAALDFSNNPLSQQIAGLSAGSNSSSNLAAQQASDVELVKLGDMATQTASLLGNGLTAEKISKNVSVAGQKESDVVVVSATATTPSLAAAIANTYTREFVNEQQGTNGQFFKSALALVRKQLAALSPLQRVGSDGLGLQDRLQTLVLLSELHYGDVQIAQEALAPTSPSSPKTKRNTLLGGLLGLLVGLGLAFLLESLDRRIKAAEDLEAIYGIPMLGAVPESAAFSSSSTGSKGPRLLLPPAEAEAFGLIRAHLRFLNIDRDLHTIVIASAASGDGKTTVACHLAEAAARLGSRVLLLEADLRSPTIAQRLQLDSSPGLSDVLIGAVPLADAIHSVDLKMTPDDGIGGQSLDVLAAGVILPPNPGKLIESSAMDGLIRTASSAYDLVVIDTPPLTDVSDGFPLLTKADGVILIGRVGHSRRDDAERLHQILASRSDSSLLGVIANSSKSGGPSAYPREGRPSSAVLAPSR